MTVDWLWNRGLRVVLPGILMFFWWSYVFIRDHYSPQYGCPPEPTRSKKSLWDVIEDNRSICHASTRRERGLFLEWFYRISLQHVGPGCWSHHGLKSLFWIADRLMGCISFFEFGYRWIWWFACPTCTWGERTIVRHPLWCPVHFDDTRNATSFWVIWGSPHFSWTQSGILYTVYSPSGKLTWLGKITIFSG